VAHLICSLLNIYLLVMLAALILSWVPLQPGSAMASVYSVLWNLTNPVLAPIRSVLPDLRAGGMSIDLSPVVAFLGITILQNIICH